MLHILARMRDALKIMRRADRTLGCALVLGALSVLCGSQAALGQEDASASAAPPQRAGMRLQAQLRAGVEYDDNALRASGSAVDSDVVARYFTAIDGSYELGGGAVVVAQVRHGGKRYARFDRADTLLTQVNVLYQRQLLESLSLGVSADLKDRTERVSYLDYHTGGVGAQLGLKLGWLGIDGALGWRYFAFKPNNATGNSGPVASLTLRAPLGESWQLNASYSWNMRQFDIRQLVPTEEPGRYEQTEQLREDVFGVLRFGVYWRGPLIVDAAYVLSGNSSNSAGQDLVRHSAQLTVTAPLPLGWLVSAHGELLRTSYDDPFLLDANFLIDEDNRNTAVLAVSKPFAERWDMELRYSLFTQEFGGARDYDRQTLMLALGCTLD